MNLEQNIVQVHIEDIIPNRFQPRLNFDEEGLKELSESIKEHGIIQPLVLRKLGDKYEIIAGERRYKAATMAGLTTVPAVVSNIDDNKAAEVAIVENVQRRNLTAIEEARSYKNLLDKGYLTQEGLAKKMGLSQSAISNKLRLLNLDDEVQQALLDEKISERHARTLLSIPDKEAQKEWLHRIINERLTVRQLDLELKKSHTKLDDSIQDEDTGVPIVSTKPSVEDIKANATDIFADNKMSVEDMMKPTEVINEEIETLDMEEPKKEEENNDSNEFVDFTPPIVDDTNIVEAPKSTDNNTFNTELIQNNNDSKFFNFAPEEDIQEEEQKNNQEENTFINPEGNDNGFEIIDDTVQNNEEIKDMSATNSSQENPFAAAEEVKEEKKDNNTFINDIPEDNNPTGFGDGINISSNNKFFKPTMEENNNNIIQEPVEEVVNPMDRVLSLENENQSVITNETMTLKDTINEIRKTIEKIGNSGVYAEIEELDFDDSYQINIKIPKDN